MTPLPRRSPGVLVSGPVTAVALDLVAETLHRLNPTALALLQACDGATPVEDVVAVWSADTGADPDHVRADVDAALASFAGLGLVDRTTPVATRTLGEAPDADRRPIAGRVHPVVGHGVQFAGSDPDLVALLDDHLGPGTPRGEPTRRFTVDEAPDGTIVLVADSEWRFVDRAALLDQVTTIVNEYGHDDGRVVTVHAAGLVDPSGRRLLLPAVSGAGKSTLAGHLVAAGWDYLGDESIGVRADDLALLPYPKPLALDATSREVLGLPADGGWTTPPAALRADVVQHAVSPGPVDLVVFPTFVAGASFAVDRLRPTDALASLVANALNLAAAGQDGMDVLDAVATTIPTYRVEHGSAADVEAWLDLVDAAAEEGTSRA